MAAMASAAGLAHVSAATGPCAVSYQVNQWTGGFTAQVGLTNNGAALSGWTLTWTFGGNQQITSAWNAQVTQSGTTVQAGNLAYNGSVATGGTVSFGFQGTFSGSNDTPADFAVNGVACNGGSSPSPTPTPTPTTTGPPCASATVFCDGFEDQTGTVPSGRWSVSTPDCSGTGAVSVDSTVAHTGSKSVRVNGGGGYCNHVFIADAADIPAAGPDVFVRFWVMHNTGLSAGHVTFVAMNDTAAGNTSLRLGGQNGALMFNRQSDDATLPDQSPAGVAQSLPLPVSTWQCIEFEVNSTSGHISTWVNGTSVPGLTEDGVPTPDIDDQWLAKPGWRPDLTDLRFGWESYASETDTLWFDDIALSSARIGCG